ncbi:MAG: thiamine phosphate synthase [Myxococcota bacterium]|nr:thiamine phosphate synthase [Myxococcota bacterium]
MRNEPPFIGRGWPQRPVLALVVDADSTQGDRGLAVAKACAEGVDWLQLRERDLEGAAWLDWAMTLSAHLRAQAPKTRIIVNRRLDLALALGADGVHLGSNAVSPEDARALLGEDALVGVSIHALGEIPGLSQAADYVHLAPIHPPNSKAATRPELGPGPLAQACAGEMPVIAQGGMDARRSPEALRCGAAGVAVTGAILHAASPALAAAELRTALDTPS